MEIDNLLAVTDDEQYLCDSARKIIFTYGEWCDKGCQWAEKHHIAYEVLQAKWQKKEDIEKAHDYANDLAILLSKKLADCMNKIHHINLPEKAWVVELADWLYYWISSSYDKYRDVVQAASKGNFNMIGEDNICIQNNMYAYKQAMCALQYNVQQYTSLLLYFGHNVVNKKGEQIKRINYVKEELTKEDYIANKEIRKQIPNGLKNVQVFFGEGIVSHRIEKLTRGGSRFLPKGSYLYKHEADMNMDLRHTLHEHIGNAYSGTATDFEKYIYENVSYFLPISYLEGFQELWRIVRGMKKLRVVVSANPVTESELNKLISVTAKLNGGKICEMQHGGGGVERYICTEGLHLEDKMYTWGWKEEYLSEKCKVMPAMKISAEKIYRKAVAKDILFVENLAKYRIMRFMDYHDSNKWDMIAEEDALIQRLTPKTFSHLIVRPYLQCEKERNQYLSEKFPGIHVSKPGVSYYKAIGKARLVICTSYSTTWLEALAADIPVMMYKNSDQIIYMGKEAKKDIQLMERVGIVQKTPENAAKFINENYDHIEKWWNSKEVRIARKRLKKRYAYSAGLRLCKLRWNLEMIKVYMKSAYMQGRNES